MHFGLYLVKNDVLTASQFVEALECQLASRPQLGTLAIELGKLTINQVFKVLRAQADNPNELFGALAVKEKVICEEELTELLLRQSISMKPLSTIVVELGYLSSEAMKYHLSEYRAITHSVEEMPASLPS